jgi:hypothetical protein
MKPILPLALVLALSSTALAFEWPIFLGHRDPEYAGYVDAWPHVVRTREFEKLCPQQQFLVMERDKAALEARTAALYGPAFGRSTSAAPAPNSTPAPPAVPTLPTAPLGDDRPAPPAPR